MSYLHKRLICYIYSTRIELNLERIQHFQHRYRADNRGSQGREIRSGEITRAGNIPIRTSTAAARAVATAPSIETAHSGMQYHAGREMCETFRCIPPNIPGTEKLLQKIPRALTNDNFVGCTNLASQSTPFPFSMFPTQPTKFATSAGVYTFQRHLQ